MNILRPPGSSTLPRFRPVNHRRRVQVVAITLGVCAALGTAAWTFGINNGEPLTYACTQDKYVVPTPDRTPVNVLNSVGPVGAGAMTAQALKDRGFNVAKFDKDDEARKIRGTGELRFGDAAKLTNILDTLRSWQPGLVLVNDGRKGPGVDFVVGLKFQSLLAEPVPPPGTPKSACKPGQPAG